MGRPCVPFNVGDKFGYLEIARVSDTRSKRGEIRVECSCDCGNIVSRTLASLRRTVKNPNWSPHCGCKWKIHGACDTRDYRVYRHIIARCYNKNDHNYHRYGGRGITVCKRWRGEQGYPNFISDMGERPTPKHEVDRIDNDGPYSPENCRWLTHIENCNNRSTNRVFIHNGKSQSLASICREEGVSYKIMSFHVVRGKTLEYALQRAKAALQGDHAKVA